MDLQKEAKVGIQAQINAEPRACGDDAQTTGGVVKAQGVMSSLMMACLLACMRGQHRTTPLRAFGVILDQASVQIAKAEVIRVITAKAGQTAMVGCNLQDKGCTLGGGTNEDCNLPD